ncbi:hypothetical protein IAR50_006948 [Cryptococcus sp. DSM 104548]
MAARASTRISIAWSGAAPIEDTDTLVLTIGSYSLDLRVFTSGQDKGKIDWATVANVSETPGSTPENPQLKWDHIIDSRPPSSLPDQGTFQTLPSADVTEAGIMFNPKTGLNEDYIETWRRFAQPAGAEYLVLEKEDGSEDGGRWFLGRMGDKALGLGKIGEKFWGWRDGLKDGVWVRLYTFGSPDKLEHLLPALPTKVSESWKKGERVELNEEQWIVREIGKL